MSRARDDTVEYSEFWKGEEYMQTFVYSKDGIPPCIPKLDGVLLL